MKEPSRQDQTLGAAPLEAACLDEQALQRLIQLDPSGEGKVFQRVMKAFDKSMARLCEQLREGRERGDERAIAHAVHTLKSSAASIGALELSRRCADIELMLKTRPAHDLDAHLDGFLLECKRVQLAVAAILAA